MEGGGNDNQAINNVDLTLRLGVANVDDHAQNDQVNRAPPPARRRVDQNDVKVCDACRTTSTPIWRKGPNGPQTLCNACGLKHARSLKETRSKIEDN